MNSLRRCMVSGNLTDIEWIDKLQAYKFNKNSTLPLWPASCFQTTEGNVT